MKKLCVLIAVCAMSLMAMAQKSELVGTWQQLDANGNPTTQVKVFMPDGKLLGLSFNADFTVSSVWFMSEYKVLNELAYVDHSLYHSDINYQRDYYFTYYKENDSVLVTRYADYRYNNRLFVLTERWKKMDREMPTYNDAEWQALKEKSLVEFNRLPKEGQTTEQYAQELYKSAQGYIKSKKLDRASEPMLIRAELDTTNLQWQKDVLQLFVENSLAPSVAEKIADRVIRLAAAKAPVPNDTSVINAYRTKAYMYNYRGNIGMPQTRECAQKAIDMAVAAGLPPTKDYGLDYFIIAMTYMPEGNLTEIEKNIDQCIDIFEKATDVSKLQMAEAYMTKAVAMMLNNRCREAIDLMLDKAIPNFVDDNGQPVEKVTSYVYPSVVHCYELLLEKTPKDKKLLKEYQQFLSDKLLIASFLTTDKKRNLFGDYLLLERGTWTLEKPAAVSDDHQILLQKDDEYIEYVREKDEERTGEMHVIVVDPAKKQDIINKWKAYKKRKK